MYKRFVGPEGRRLLIGALRSQPLAQGQENLATAFADAGEVKRYGVGQPVISQGEDGNSLFLLCAGRVSVRVHGREVAVRQAGEHIGDMALLEPSAPRSATLVALEETVALEIPEANVHALAIDHPELWHSMARVLAARLRQRDAFVAARGTEPRLFIGSSSEGKDVADAVQAALTSSMYAEVWTNGIFKPSLQTLEALEARLHEFDFAALVLSADDVVRSRGKQRWAPRDNVLLEVGLFCGALGRERTFILAQSDADLKLPSDLYGLTLLTYKSGSLADLGARLGAACTEIRKVVQSAGPR